MPVTTMTKTGQVTVGKELRKLLGVKPGDKVFLDFKNGAVQIERVPTNEEFLQALDAIGSKKDIPKIDAEKAVRAYRDGKSEAVIADYRRKYEVA